MLGIFVAVLFGALLSSLLDRLFAPSFWNQIIAFLVLFVLSYLLVKLFEAGLKNMVERASLENLDRALGLFLGLIEGMLLVFILLFILNYQPFFSLDESISESFFGTMLRPSVSLCH